MASTTHSAEHGLSKFHRLLLDQVRHEFTASHQYVALATWYDDRHLPQFARIFYRQALEERDHAMMIVRYLIDRDVPVTIPRPDEIQNEFQSPREPVALALSQEQRVTEQFHVLSRVAREENDYTGEQFLLWFLKEQVEEEHKMSTILDVVDRAAGGSLFEVETWLAREMPDETGGDADAPETAGPALTV
ncbi:ferritin [Nocardiopsis composta]|uniref:Ferritin n=1 Tax=Nocardiopsis composta TaxID=157465 RepID=A0A7W8QSK9_9ACTN|nr:ferritin [Nocardiopsis composta]MBB5435827.1 ferritin [Nocardiopsis composta]